MWRGQEGANRPEQVLGEGRGPQEREEGVQALELREAGGTPSTLAEGDEHQSMRFDTRGTALTSKLDLAPLRPTPCKDILCLHPPSDMGKVVYVRECWTSPPLPLDTCVHLPEAG